MENKTDKAWSEIFKDQKLGEALQAADSKTINADTINRYRECRLMTKFDHSSNLPKVFKQYNVNILPVSRSKFLIGRFNAYAPIENIRQKPQFVPMRDDLVSLPSEPENITGEHTAIACAYASGIFRRYAQVTHGSIWPTLTGRVGSGDFDFKIRGTGRQAVHDIAVRRAQMELDAVFETPDAVYLIEAKNHDCDDFIIRQLYYPYRYLSNLNKQGKEIVPVFMQYVNGTYYLHRYRFNDINELDSIEYVDGAAYTFVRQKITASDMDALLKVRKADEPDIPFPQADRLARVEDIMNGLAGNGGALSFQEIIALNLDFTSRQGDYYINAGKYLGLYGKGGDGKIHFTDEGKKIQGLAYRERKLAIAKRILKAPVFSACYRKLIQNGGIDIQDADITAALGKYRPDLNPTTAGRRAQTVRAWLKWITDLVEEY